MGKYEDLEKEEAEYELARLARDSMTIPVVTVVATALTGPIGGAAAAVGMGVKAVGDKLRRDRERNKS